MGFELPAVLRRLVDDETGATAIEYALIGAVVSIIIIGSLHRFGDAVTAKFDYISDRVVAAMGS